MNKSIYFLLLLILSYTSSFSQGSGENYVSQHFTKMETYIPMRDGVKLFTEVFLPKDASEINKYPIMMQRTCYGIAPYGVNQFPPNIGPSDIMMKEGYIFVYQDVRGRFKSEGIWNNMTPVIDNKKDNTDIDEGSDTYDTIDWLIKNIAVNNGRVGQWGISYPGFFTAAGILSNHPALKASAPEAPISDFFFDDFHHNGAFLESYFFAYPVVGIQKKDTTSKAWFMEHLINAGTSDGYQFLLDMGPLKNADKYYKDNFFWQQTVNHPNYDEFWQKRSLARHFGKIIPAVMFVGGWYDAEDLSGPLDLFKRINKTDPAAYNTIVMGPFGHGRWAKETGHTMHSNIYFGDSIATFYQRDIEAKFFRNFLKDNGNKDSGLPKAYMYDTGKKEWEKFDEWPVVKAVHQKFYLGASGRLEKTQPATTASMSYISDPLKPVPYTEDNSTTMGFTPHNYMTEDQRFAGRRTDVLVYETGILNEDITLGGEIKAHLKVATTGTDGDYIIKLIDVYPPDESNNPYMPNKNIILSNYWQMVRSEIMPARFRKGFEKAEPMMPGQKTDVNVRLQDVLHTFKKGHRIMIQVQSTAFPLFARNPQKFVENPYKANEKDYIKATETVFNDSFIDVEVLK